MNLQTRARAACLLVGLATVASACGGGDTEVQMGLKRITLDLAFEADDAAAPAARVEARPPVLQTDFALTAGNRLVVLPPPSSSLYPVLRTDCPAAPAGAVPSEPVTVGITRPPAAGLYPTRNDGTLVVQAGPSRFEGPYPRDGRVEIANVVDETPPPDAIGQPGVRTIEFDHVVPVGNTTKIGRAHV